MRSRSITPVPAPYESGQLQAVTGPILRPGGIFLTDRAASFCDFVPGSRLLDVGCGAGATVEHLVSRYGYDATGIDHSRILLDQALRRNPFLALTEGRAEELTCPDGTMDGIFCECVLSLLAEPRQALTEFRRVLRPGGCLVLSDLYQRRDWTTGTRQASPEGGRSGWITTRTLGRALRQGGFSILFWEDHTPLLKELAARLVLAGLSPVAFCGGECGGVKFPADAKPGYYLLVARRLE